MIPRQDSRYRDPPTMGGLLVLFGGCIELLIVAAIVVVL